MATDSRGNCFVTGRFSGTASFDSLTVTSTGSYDAFLAKYDSAGNIQWVQPSGGAGQDDGYAVATDSAGNCYMTGDFSGTAGFGTTNLVSAGDYDVFLAKYDPSGALLWVQQFGGTNRDIGYGLAVDRADNCHLAGYYIGTASLGTTVITNAGSCDIFLAKLSSDGQLQWLQRAGGPGDDRAWAIAVDSSGNPFVCGLLGTAASFGVTNTTSLGNDFYMAKFGPDGTAEWVIWGGSPTSSDGAYGVGTDASGNSYVTGNVGQDAWLGSTNLTTSSSGCFTAKFDPLGALQWVQTATSPDGGIWAYAIAVDTNGNSCVGGSFIRTAIFGPTNLVSSSVQMDAFAACYDSAGTVQWVYQMGGTASDYARAMAVDLLGNFYVTGDFRDVARFGSIILTGTSSSRMYVAKIASGLPFLSINRTPPEQLLLTLKANKGSTCRIDFTTNWSNWFPFATATDIQGPTNFIDTLLTNEPIKFYRALMNP